ncbi:hypothetical protein [Sphingomonas zeae]
MDWTSKGADRGCQFADLADPVGKAGTNDSVAIVSAIVWVARALKLL